MKRILIDVDGVIAAYSEAFIEAYMKCGGNRVSPTDVTDWDFELCLPRCKELSNYIRAYTHAPGFALELAPYPGAVKAVKRLMQVCEVVFVTQPLDSKTWAHDRAEWLRNHFGPCTIVSTKHKHLVKGDVIVDDRGENVLEWLQSWPDGQGIVWAQPWNSESRLYRTNDWADVLEAVTG